MEDPGKILTFTIEDEIASDKMLTLKEIEEIYPTRLHATQGAYKLVFNANKDIAEDDKIELYLGTMHHNEGKVVGIDSKSGATTPWFRIRCDYDPDKGFHFNAEVGKGNEAQRKACIVRAKGQKPEDTQGEYEEHMKWINDGQPASRIRDLWRGHSN